MDVGARITALREQRGLTTNRLANLCGLSQSFLRSVELGEKGITVDNLELVCNALHITLHDFFAQNNTNDLGRYVQDFLISLTPIQRETLTSMLSLLR